jgi:hypothetical protein
VKIQYSEDLVSLMNIISNLNERSTFTVKLGVYVGMLISLWLFLFAAQPKEFSLDRLMKLEQRSHKCEELKGNM